MSNQLQSAGAQPNREAKFVPLFMDRAFTGLYTQRSPLHDPSDWVTSKFYGGRPDALLDGSNIELTNRLTLQRRPGLVPFSTTTYPSPPDRAFDFELTDGTIRVIIDTGTTGALAVTSVASSSGTTAVYTGTFPAGAGNAYVGMYFTVTGFTIHGPNNGTYLCSASTTTTLTLVNSNAVSESAAASAISTGAVYYDHQDGTKSVIFGKASGAGQTHFVAVAGVLYMGDGVEVKKYKPGNTNGEVWDWGIAAPTVKPGVNIISAGSAETVWQATTYFSTMGIIIDSNGNAQQLVSVNNDGSNPNSQFGLSGSGSPVWNHTLGGTTTDGTVTWRTVGTLLPWTANVLYANYAFATDSGSGTSCSIFDVLTNALYVDTSFNHLDSSNPRGFGKPNFTGVVGSVYFEGTSTQLTWQCIGGLALHQWSGGVGVSQYQFVVEGPNAPSPGQLAYLHAAENNGVTDAGTVHPAWHTQAGQFTPDNQLQWVCLGNATWTAAATYTKWTNSGDPNFSCIEDSNGNLQVCVVSGVSAGVQPTWAFEYASVTTESTGVQWANVGLARPWQMATSFHLPFSGFSPSTSTTSFGGSSVLDSNGNVQYVTQSGYSGALQPVWDVTVGQITQDPVAPPTTQIFWLNRGTVDPKTFSWTHGFQYVYAYKDRTTGDSYNTIAPPLWLNPLGTPTGGETGAVSSASPKAVISSGHASAVIELTLTGSTDPQVDTIEVYRTTDGGSTFLFLTDIPNPAPISGSASTIILRDYMPDSPTDTLPGLNSLIEAAINGVNNPPNVAFLPMAFNFQRIWGAVGSSVYFSGGPDTLVGNPNEAFDVADTFPFLANCVRLVKTTRGLVVFLTDSVELIAGGPLTASFFSVTLAPGVGLQSYNALDVYAGEIYFFSADSQFKVMSPELQLANYGFPIGDKLAEWDASRVYVAVLQAGLDSCMFVADGSTGWYRLNPRQVPGGFSGPEPIWSPFADITNGCKMVQTVEVLPGIKRLLVGSDDPSRKVLQRALNVFTDDSQTYDAFFVMGSMMLANPGQLALLKFIEADFSGFSFQPTVSFLLNEISGTFTPFTQAPVFDPPQIYGKTITPSSYSPNRYYFAGEPTVARCRHLQIKMDFGATDNGDELYNLTIFGRLVVEP